MAVKHAIPYNDGHYFITFTCYKWLPLIELTKAYDSVYKWFDYLKTRGHFITGYVIMPNHIHVLIGFRNEGKSINKTIGDGKRFLAYEIVKRLEHQGERAILAQLQAAVEPTDKQRNKKHEVWSDSFDWKECRSRQFVDQKLDYIHRNPCAGKWNLAACPAAYEHSSARFYAEGIDTHGLLTNAADLEDVDLTKRVDAGNAPAESTQSHKAGR
jgi:REP element-mobilizing transposase RayT